MIYRPACPRSGTVSRHASHGKLHPGPQPAARRGQRNADLRLEVSPSTVTEEHFDLYRRYVNARHPGGGMEDPTRRPHRADWCATPISRPALEGRLVATAVTESDPRSAVGGLRLDRGFRGAALGTFAVMTQAAFAQRHGLDHFTSYWVDGSPKMEYKARFRPLEVFRNGAWHLLRENRAPPTS